MINGVINSFCIACLCSFCDRYYRCCYPLERLCIDVLCCCSSPSLRTDRYSIEQSTKSSVVGAGRLLLSTSSVSNPYIGGIPTIPSPNYETTSSHVLSHSIPSLKLDDSDNSSGPRQEMVDQIPMMTSKETLIDVNGTDTMYQLFESPTKEQMQQRVVRDRPLTLTPLRILTEDEPLSPSSRGTAVKDEFGRNPEYNTPNMDFNSPSPKYKYKMSPSPSPKKFGHRRRSSLQSLERDDSERSATFLLLDMSEDEDFEENEEIEQPDQTPFDGYEDGGATLAAEEDSDDEELVTEKEL